MLLIKVSDLLLYVGFIFFNLHKRFRPAVCPDHSINGCKGKLQNLPETPKNAKKLPGLQLATVSVLGNGLHMPVWQSLDSRPKMVVF